MFYLKNKGEVAKGDKEEREREKEANRLVSFSLLFPDPFTALSPLNSVATQS